MTRISSRPANSRAREESDPSALPLVELEAAAAEELDEEDEDAPVVDVEPLNSWRSIVMLTPVSFWHWSLASRVALLLNVISAHYDSKSDHRAISSIGTPLHCTVLYPPALQ